MFKTEKIIEKAKEGSKFHLFLLNNSLQKMIPFNKPHGISVLELTDHSLKTSYPYKQKNLNHIKGLHACGLATLSEFTTGMLLSLRLNMKEYRLIMQSITVEYKYQGKMDATAEFKITDEWLSANVIDPLRSADKVIVTCEVDTMDTEANLLCTAKINWQIKKWKTVKTTV